MATSDKELGVPFSTCDEVTETDIASTLVLLKKKHRLSVHCVNDIISFLKILKVPNTPSSWYKVKRLLNDCKPTSTEYFICPVCNQITNNNKQYTNCSTNHHEELQSFRSFSIQEQLQSVLLNNTNIDLSYTNDDLIMRDIHDGAFYKSICTDKSKEILTLTINVDGVQPSKGSQSTIWPILLTINEIPRNLRFKLENVVFGGIWPGPSKPSHDQVRLFLRPFIDELLRLERGYRFRLADGNIHTIHVYLIGACCDKPAQAALQCIAEPAGSFGCGRCEVEGDFCF